VRTDRLAFPRVHTVVIKNHALRNGGYYAADVWADLECPFATTTGDVQRRLWRDC